jgi:hypothetical protein
LSVELKPNTISSEALVIINLEGTKENVIKIAQQLAWFTAIFRVPQDGNLSFSNFSMCQLMDPETFKFQPCKLKHVENTSKACWHPLFRNWALAQGFPIRPRHGEFGLELPFAAMVQLSEVLGPVSYKGGVVLKGLSSILFPVQQPVLQNDPEQTSGQWHLVHLQREDFANLSLLDQVENRWPCQFTDLESLSMVRTFLGCYKKVKIHLATADGAYNSIQYSATRASKPKPEFSGFSFGASIAKIAGLTSSANFTIPRHSPIPRDFGPYEQALAHCTKMPVILYDTLDRRAWMVPAISVIFHMVHIWFHKFRDHFPTKIERPPYVTAVSNIGRETLMVLSQNSTFQLYQTLDEEPYPLKALVTKYCLEYQKLLAVPRYHSGIGADGLVGWDLMEIVHEQVNDPKTTNLGKFEGNWDSLAQDPNMIVFFGHDFGDVIVPDFEEQRVCNSWRSVPPGKDYLTASIHCLRQCTNYFPASKCVGKRNQTPSLGDDVRAGAFADCSHDDRIFCHRGQSVWSEGEIYSIVHNLEEEGAIIFGDKKKLKKIHRDQ